MTFWKSNIIGTENRLVFGWLDKVVERWGGLITKWMLGEEQIQGEIRAEISRKWLDG